MNTGRTMTTDLDATPEPNLRTRLALYRCQVEIRQFEKRAYDLFLQNLVKGTSHLSLGQEAIAAGFGASSIIKPLLLIPAGWPSVSDFLKNLGWSVASIFWHSRVHQDLQIGRLAILDAAQDILLIFGIFAMWGRARAKLYVLAVCAGLSIVAASFNSSYNLLLFTLPPIGLVISAGLRYLHLEWISVFPRNPLPRGLAIALLVAVAVVQVIWGAHYALTAWPHSL